MKTITIPKLLEKLDPFYDGGGSLQAKDGGGDTLALFLVNEIKSLKGHKKRLNINDLIEIKSAYHRAIEDIKGVIKYLDKVTTWDMEKA